MEYNSNINHTNSIGIIRKILHDVKAMKGRSILRKVFREEFLKWLKGILNGT